MGKGGEAKTEEKGDRHDRNTVQEPFFLLTAAEERQKGEGMTMLP